MFLGYKGLLSIFVDSKLLIISLTNACASRFIVKHSFVSHRFRDDNQTKVNFIFRLPYNQLQKYQAVSEVIVN